MLPKFAQSQTRVNFASVAKRSEAKSARFKLGNIAASDLAFGREIVADDDGGDAVIKDFVLAFA